MERVFTGWFITARQGVGVVWNTEASTWETAVTQLIPPKTLRYTFLIAETGNIRSTQVFENVELK